MDSEEYIPTICQKCKRRRVLYVIRYATPKRKPIFLCSWDAQNYNRSKYKFDRTFEYTVEKVP